ncbi:FlgD immunoglobulin-like domain containing protein [Streptomyces sp. NPDC094032]|uniref:FlgD immunoglobulin-like domain containing protein n=1 Tax=Streptomyces sp. NPDC094032 TaxID=3155308 RepID=UPI00332E63B4
MGITLTVGGLAPLATAAETPVAQEVVVPATFKGPPRGGKPYLAEQSRYSRADGAGVEGFFHTEEGLKGVQWTRYADGTTVQVTEPATPWTSVQATGDDLLAYLRNGEVELRHASGAVQTVKVPAGLTSVRVFGSTVVAYKETTKADGTKELVETHLLSARPDGTTQDVTVTDESGKPAVETWAVDSDGTSLVMSGEAWETLLVSKETGRITQRGVPTPGLMAMAVSPKYIALQGSSDKKVRLLSRGDLSAAPVIVDIDAAVTAATYDEAAVVGESLVYRDYRGGIWSQPIAGGAAVKIVASSTANLSTGPDGTAVVIGGTSNQDWGIRRITADAEGTPTATLVKRFAPIPAKIQGIALTQGRLAVADDSFGIAGRVDAYVRTVDPASDPAVDSRKATLPPLNGCAADNPACSRLLGLGDGRFARYARFDGTSKIYAVGRTGSNREWETPLGSVLSDAAPNQLLHAVPGPPARNQVLDIDKGVSREYPAGAVALDGAWNWAPSTRDEGTLVGRSVTDPGQERRITGGIPCTPQELQKSGRWIYWNCGPNGPAGVLDSDKMASRTVPAGEALLGDGYVVTHDKAAGKLVLTGLDPAQPVSRVVGDLPDTGVSQRHVRWTVDRFGGGVAYVDAQEQVHVVPSGIATQPLAVVDQRDAAFVDAGPTASPLGSLTLSKPVASWSLSVRNTVTDQVYDLPGGGEARGAITPTWNGKDAAGNPLPNAAYTWTLTAKPADGVGADVTVQGTTSLRKSIPTASEAYTSVTPARVMDTRNGTGVAKAKIGAKGTVTLDLAGKGGVPATGVTAVALNLTVTNATASTFVTAYPYGTARPNASNVNVPARKTVPNLVVVPVKDGKVTFSNNSGTVDLIADVQGYYAPGAGDLYTPLTPSRLLDTRSGLGAPKYKVGSSITLPLGISRKYGKLPYGTKSVVLNVTATNPTDPTVVSVVPYMFNNDWTGPSLLNVAAGQTASNLVVAPVIDGQVYLYNKSGAVDLIADVQGYYDEAGPGSRFEPLAPSRLLDTRTGTGAAKAKVGAKGEITLTVGGKGGVSAVDVTAVVLNVTATNTTANTYVTAYPYGTTRTAASNLNVPAGSIVSNLVVVPVKDGKVTLYNHAGTTDLVADVQGYFAE